MVVRELLTKIGFVTDEASMNKANLSAQKLIGGIKMGGIAVAAGIGMIAKGAISAAADMEMLTTQFEVMLGNSEAAAAMMGDLKKFASATPFSLEDLATGSQQLMSFGVQSDKVIESLRMIGDTSGGSAEKMQGLVLAYGKVVTRGKASMEELNMMAERGLPIFQVLADQMGVSKEQLMDMVSKGQIGAEQVQEAFKTMTSEGGMFFEGMKKQSETLIGLISTMKDNFRLLLADAGTKLLPVMKELNKVLISLSEGAIKTLVENITKSLVPIVELFGGLLPQLVNILSPVFEALSEIITPLAGLLGEMLTPLLETIFTLIGPLVEILKNILIPVIDLLRNPLTFIIGLFKIFSGLVTEFAPVFAMLPPIIAALMPPMQAAVQLFLMIYKVFASLLVPIIQLLIPILGLVVNILMALMPLFTALLQWFTALMPIMQVWMSLLVWLVTGILSGLVIPALNFLVMVLGWVVKGIAMVVEAFTWMINSILDMLPGDLFGTDEEKKAFQIPPMDFSVQVQTPALGGTEAMKVGIPPATGGGGVNLTNNIAVDGSSVKDAAATKQTMERIAESVFTIQLKKVLIDAGV